MSMGIALSTPSLVPSPRGAQSVVPPARRGPGRRGMLAHAGHTVNLATPATRHEAARLKTPPYLCCAILWRLALPLARADVGPLRRLRVWMLLAKGEGAA